MPVSLQKCTHIFIHESPIKSNLSPAYSGPYLVLSRNDKVFTILKDERAIKVSINNVKPGFLANNLAVSAPEPYTSRHSSFHAVYDPGGTDVSQRYSPQPPSQPKPRYNSRYFLRRQTFLPSHLQDYEL